MVETALIGPLAGHAEFDSLIARLADEYDADKAEVIRAQIIDQFAVEGTVFISDMASFSSTSRKRGVCHFLKLIHRARQIIAPIIAANNGRLLKCEADNCYAFFKTPDEAIRASFDINAALFESNRAFELDEHIFLSVGIDYGRVLLVGDKDFFGDPVNTASKLGEDLAIHAETLVTKRALEHSNFRVPELAERMVARISDIEIKYVRLPMTAETESY
ncbi:MAG: adenylate/guanylate cyclase domain-containing protein [Gammaproteobacteria bacterium]|nr:adenylate/guanylate cyclase domain-containing protein [Gammaproteobacteria bacterium]MDH3480688.1 adenylate/guanylate cyclase domain-containing protein [Gammaproteobacteria bacterium]